MTKITQQLTLIGMMLPIATVGAWEIDPYFSLDPASPSLQPDDLTPDDVLISGPAVQKHGRDLGLSDNFLAGEFDTLNALSFGRDPIKAPLYFSVDRVAVGEQGTAVYEQAQPGVEEASGDVFVSNLNQDNGLNIDEQELGLLPGFFGDDLDALDLDPNLPKLPNFPNSRYYFSIDQLSETNNYGTGTVTSDILWSDGDGEFFTYFDLEALGFDPTSDLDALILWDWDLGESPNADDFALFSLSSFSPDTYTHSGQPYAAGVLGQMSPSDILWTDFQDWGLWVSAGDLGLRSDDELNALDTIPEPMTLSLFGAGLFGLWGVLRRRA
ncbi:MAG: PEP-CTERM sorting domain-containing protein [Thiohalocapsa sp. PB-PSB1]|nr:MAG: PEP-CTERM sorting domain-containing protein [Thiohalocapsa sp. PB-PSB1]